MNGRIPRAAAARRAALAALLLLAGAASGGEAARLAIVEHDPLLRGGLVYRCLVQRAPLAGEPSGPFTLQVTLAQGGVQLASLELPIERLEQLRDGVRVVLVPGTPADGRPAALRATLVAAGRRFAETVTVEVATPLGVRLRLEALYGRLVSARDAHPLPRLWAEQAAGLMLAGDSLANHAALETLAARLEAWLSGTRPDPGQAGVHAWRDPVDGSVQPYRLHPAGAPGGIPAVLLLHHPRALAKHAWPEPPAAWLQAARAAGMTLIEPYPAGDREWRGVALQRVPRLLDSLGAAAGARPLLVAGGAAAEGAIRLAEDHPGRWAGLALASARWEAVEQAPGDDARWLALRLRGGGRPEHLARLPVLVAGAEPPALGAWRARLQAAGGTVSNHADGPADVAWWERLAASARRAQADGTDPERYLALVPGRYGPVVVEDLERWARPASIAGGAQPTVEGAARWRRADAAPGARPGPVRTLPASGRALRKLLGQAQGPLDGYASDPFVVVQGTGENAAAARQAADLANGFLAAWIAHAQGAPPRIDDTRFDEAAFPGHHLVLVGNPRSNQVLARLVERGLRLPLAWSGREIRCGDDVWLRSERRCVALAWPHPAADGRLLVIIDGAPAWTDAPTAGAPLAGLPDLVVGAAGGQPARPRDAAVWRLFDCDWR